MPVRGDEPVRLLDVGGHRLPLGISGLLPGPGPGARRLFSADALVETRDRRGRFVDVRDVGRPLRGWPLGSAWTTTSSSPLARHAGHRLRDDLALLLAERCPAQTRLRGLALSGREC